MVSESPDMLFSASCGMPQSGPGIRGNSRNNINMTGKACSNNLPAYLRLKRSLKSVTPLVLGWLTLTQVASKISVGANINAPTAMLWLNKKVLMVKNKPPKIIKI